MTRIETHLYGVAEWGYTSGITYADPFNEIQIDVIVVTPSGEEARVPAYWASGTEWRVRYSPRDIGEYTFCTVCSDESNSDLHGRQGVLSVQPYRGSHPLFEHGPLRMSESRHHLEHSDGKPFYWLADTWWLGASKRLDWPDGFQLLTADRASKGFSVIQIIAGLPCDMPAFDERATNEAGHPWEPDYARINPAFFDMMDLRIQWLVRSGLVPCIYGAFSFHLQWMGKAKMAQHWRYLIARYGAYPVIWCLAGCVPMPFYLSEDFAGESAQLRQDWQKVAQCLRESDPYGHPLLVEPLPFQPALDADAEAKLLDGYMLHAGAGDVAKVGDYVQQLVAQEPHKPVIVAESGFEGQTGCSADDHRRKFWSLSLLGLAGYSYAAAGLWQFNSEGSLFGPAPYGATQSNRLWTDAYRLPGSAQLGLGRRFLERYPWWRFESHPEWVQPHADEADARNPYAAGIPAGQPGEVRFIYLAKPVFPPPFGQGVTVLGLDPEATYTALLFDPITGAETPLPSVSGCDQWPVPLPPVVQDWVLVLERAGDA